MFFPIRSWRRKGIQKVEDLKGKTGHVGAPFGTIPDTALRFALNRLKIDPEKDVKLVQHSNADPASILAAMEKGEVQFGIFAPPFDLIAEKRGYEMLLALPGLGIPWQQNGELVPASYLKSNRDNVVRLLRATAEAEKFYFDQKEKTIEIMTEYLGRPARRNRIRLQPIQALDRPHPTAAGRNDQNDARSDQEKYPQRRRPPTPRRSSTPASSISWSRKDTTSRCSKRSSRIEDGRSRIAISLDLPSSILDPSQFDPRIDPCEPRC